MSYDGIRSALESALELFAQGQTPTLKVKYENVPALEELGADESHIAGLLLPEKPTPATIGINSVDRLNGIFKVDVLTLRDQGSKDALEIVDALGAHFSRGKSFTAGVTVVTVERTWPAAAESRGSYRVTPVNVSWFSFE